MVSTGQKKNSIYSHIRTDGDTATEDELTVTFPEFRGTPVTVGCEVKVLRDNGYGKLSTLQKRAEVLHICILLSEIVRRLFDV